MFREDQENRPVISYPSKGYDIQSVFSKGESDFNVDPYSVSIINEMLTDDKEWSEVPEIVKLTFSAFQKVINSQNAAIKDIENALPMKANKVDVHNMMSTKVNVKDIRKTISEVAQDIDNRVTVEEVK